jgi:hypothetical protein
MVRLACLAAAAVLVLSPDLSGILHSQPPQENQAQDHQDQSAPVAAPASETAPSPQPQAAKKDAPLQEESRMMILRSVDGEFARVLTSLPGGRKGFHFRAGEPIDQNALRKAIQSSGAVLNTGDNVQITKLDFQGKEIVIDLNGGGRKQGSWKSHVQMQIGLPTQPVQTGSQTTRTDGGGAATSAKKTGATLFLDFDRALPDMTADEVKEYLSEVLDFSKQRSAAVQYTQTLPPKVQEAIAQKRAEVGMDRDEVIAALGRPERKVREREADGGETEDWIYGRPPARTTFVRFTGEKVTEVNSYPD